MESFLSTLPAYVHQYINKYPPTDCFSVLKELICFAVLYSNDRERTNLLSLDLLNKKADQAITHRPYTSSTLTLSSLTSTLSQTSLMSPDQSMQLPHLVPGNKSAIPPSPALSNRALKESNATNDDHECESIMEEEQLDTLHRSGTPTTAFLGDTATAGKPSLAHKATTMPYTFPDWWAHPDDGSTHRSQDSAEKSTLRSSSPLSSNERQRLTKTPERSMTTTQEMNITNWIPVDFNEHSRPTRSQTTSRPSSVYNPSIPDLRSYLSPTKPNQSKKPVAKDTPKVTRRTSVPSTTLCDSPIVTPTLSRSKPTTNLSRSSSTSTYRPGQTATVRARAEAAKQRQLQLEEEKRKQAAAAAKLTSRASLRLKQSAPSGIDWEAIKQDRRKTMPAQK